MEEFDYKKIKMYKDFNRLTPNLVKVQSAFENAHSKTYYTDLCNLDNFG